MAKESSYDGAGFQEHLPEATGEKGMFEVYSRRYDTFHDPERVFSQLFADEEYAFWLDSSQAEAGLSRFSFMGSGSGPLSKVIRYDTETKRLEIIREEKTEYRRGSIFEYLAQELAYYRVASPDLPFDFNCGYVGYFGYELKGECGAQNVHSSPLPDAMFIFADRLIVFDHAENVMYFVCFVPRQDSQSAQNWFNVLEQQLQTLSPLSAGASLPRQYEDQPLYFHLTRPYTTYLHDIQACKYYLTRGDSYEVCLTNTLETVSHREPLALYRNLRRLNPAPYAAFFRFDEIGILSSSPERFLRIDRQRMVEAKPIKGTSRRGTTAPEDQHLRAALASSEKTRAENLMIVDLLRNDLGRVCEVGSVHVPGLMNVESYRTVHQLVSTIRGTLRADLHVLDCLRAAFPGGSMTGAPKLRTMSIIDNLETQARGIYSGAIGFLGLNGTLDLNIVIRTLVITPEKSSIGIGGAIVIQSDPEEEFDEILLKARAIVHAIVLTRKGVVDDAQYRVIDGRS